jgi:magnesium-transporting ATPase (P-type)
VLRRLDSGPHGLTETQAGERLARHGAVLDRCPLADDERERLRGLAARQAHGGLRVLAAATAVRPARARPCTPADERGPAFQGFVTFRDALTPTAADARRRGAQTGCGGMGGGRAR